MQRDYTGNKSDIKLGATYHIPLLVKSLPTSSGVSQLNPLFPIEICLEDTATREDAGDISFEKYDYKVMPSILLGNGGWRRLDEIRR